MRGMVDDYNKDSQIGYIKGYDDDLYIFRGRDIRGDSALEEGDIVEFDYTIYRMEEMSVAWCVKKYYKRRRL